MNGHRDKMPVELTVNGRRFRTTVESRRLLSDVLRHDLRLTGTHVGCEQGACGSCTVLLDGEPVRSCLMFAVQCSGMTLTTIEGLAPEGTLHPLQHAFMQRHGLQCGFCTPGMLLSAKALLDVNPLPSEAEVRDWLAGNLCRCTGYQFIVDAVLEAARRIREDPS
jgi:carbon-monoxide dehydrogenase small subunit